MHDRFSKGDSHARHFALSCAIDYVKKALQQDDEVEGILLWEKDIPFLKSLSGNDVRRSKTLQQSTDRKLPNNLLLALGVCNEDALPNIYRLLIIACTQPITS